MFAVFVSLLYSVIVGFGFGSRGFILLGWELVVGVVVRLMVVFSGFLDFWFVSLFSHIYIFRVLGGWGNFGVFSWHHIIWLVSRS